MTISGTLRIIRNDRAMNSGSIRQDQYRFCLARTMTAKPASTKKDD